jgi:hypothetical protein
MSFNYRCSRDGCRQRKTLRHEYEWYIRKPKCPACKRDTLKFDGAVRRQTIARTCHCRGIYFPHRRDTVLSEQAFCHNLTLDQVEATLELQK